MMKSDKNNLIIFVKYPEKVEVKTRIGNDIGSEKAKAIYSAITLFLLSVLSNSDYYSMTVAFTPKNIMKDVKDWLNIHHAEYKPQLGESLGEKISDAFDKSFNSGFLNTVIIGSDCIEINGELINKAFDYLEDHDCVLGPARDGGFYLIGLKNQNYPYIFNGIEWSTDKVLKSTIKKIDQNNLSYKLLDVLNDIDKVEDVDDRVLEIVRKYNPGFVI